MENSKFHDIVQVAVVVKDIQAAIDRYESIYGIGPWGTMHLTKETALHLIDNGRTVPDGEDFHVILAATRVGGVELELIQPVTPNSIYYSFLQEHGEGQRHRPLSLQSTVRREGICPGAVEGHWGRNRA